MLSLIKRVVCRYKHKFSSRLGLKYYCKKVEYFDMPSALYAGLETRGKLVTYLDPYLDVNSTFCDMEKLKTDLQKRNIDFDIDSLDSLLQQSVLYEKVIELLKYTKESIEELKKTKVIMSKNEEKTDDKVVSDLDEKIAEADEALSAANEELRILERTFVVPFLQIPNSLHKNTTENDECLFSLFSKPKFPFPVKSHTEIGKKNDELCFKDVSPTSYYFKGKLAQLELAVSEFIMNRFQEHDFGSYANVDTAKAVLAEGCGIIIKNNNNLRIEDPDCLAFNQVQFIFGSSSLTSFVALFCKGLVEFAKPLPVRLVTTGRKYKQRNNKTDESSLFSAIQSSSVSAFVAYPLECSEEAIVNEIAMLMNQTYTELGLHFTLVQYGASKLEPYESLAVGLCLFSPFSKSYIEVGRISLCQDFISKRLQIYQNMGKRRAAFLGMIYVEIMDIKNWIGCLMENTQTLDGEYSIPKCLEKFFV